MMRRVMAGVLLCAIGAAAATRVHGPLYRADGSPAVGDLYITCSRVIAEGKTIVGGTIKTTLAAGVIDVTLYANDAATPAGSSCKVQYDLRLDNGKPDVAGSYEETWVVTSATPTTVGAIRVVSRPSPAVMVLPQQIAATGLVSGTYCLSVTNGAITGLAACSGGGGGALFDSIPGLFDSIPGLFDSH